MRVSFVTIFAVGVALYLYVVHRFFPRRIYRAKSGLGLVLGAGRRDPVRSGTDIIFVHGLGSNPETAWKSRNPESKMANKIAGFSSSSGKRDVCWPTDFLSEDLQTAGRHGDRIFFYNYDSYWYRDAAKSRLSDLANQMLITIQDEIRTRIEDRPRRLLFVCHSYGGLLVKKALVQASGETRFENILRSTKGLVFLGTPQRGSSFSIVGITIALMLWPFGGTTSTLIELQYRSPSLLSLDRRFTKLLDTYRLSVLGVGELKQTVTGVGPFVIRTFPVPMDSAEVLGPDELVINIGLPLDHRSLNKFGERDSNYNTIRHRLIAMLSPVLEDMRVLPYRRIDTYTERPNLSRELDASVLDQADVNMGTNINIVHGLGGAGKTQLVLDFISRQHSEFNPILWINAQSRESIKNSFEQCVQAMKLKLELRPLRATKLQDYPAIVATRQFLVERDGEDRQWLMIIDNVDEENPDYLEDIIPDGLTGNIIIISQHAHMHRFPFACPRIKVDLLPESEAVQLLLKRLVASNSVSLSSETMNIVHQLNKSLGHLALAVDLTGAYILQEELNGVPTDDSAILEDAFKRYMASFDNHSEEMLDWASANSPYEKSVATVWALTLKAIEARYPEYVSDFFTLIASFDCASVSDDVFRWACFGFHALQEHHKIPPEVLPHWLGKLIGTRTQRNEWDKFYYERATSVLARYGLVQTKSPRTDASITTLSIHRLIQWSTARKLRQSEWSEWLLWFYGSIAMFLLINAGYESDEVYQFFRHFSTALPYFIDIFISFDKMTPDNLIPVQMLADITHRENRQEYAEAITGAIYLSRMRTHGTEDHESLAVVCKLAEVYSSSNKLQQAVDLFKEVLEIYERGLGLEHATTISTMSSLAITFARQGRWTNYFRLQTKVVDLSMKLFGMYDERTLNAYDGLMRALAHLKPVKNHDGATISKTIDETYESVMRVKTAIHGRDHESVQFTMTIYAEYLEDSGNLDEALKLWEDILTSRQRYVASDHTLVLYTVMRIVKIHRLKGNLAHAEKLEKAADEVSARRMKRLRAGGAAED